MQKFPKLFVGGAHRNNELKEPSDGLDRYERIDGEKRYVPNRWAATRFLESVVTFEVTHMQTKELLRFEKTETGYVPYVSQNPASRKAYNTTYSNKSRTPTFKFHNFMFANIIVKFAGLENVVLDFNQDIKTDPKVNRNGKNYLAS